MRFNKKIVVRTRRFELPHPKALPPQGSVSTVPPRAQLLKKDYYFEKQLRYKTTEVELNVLALKPS